jgi:hypothetical protein
MAVDPATIKAIAMIAKQAIEDEQTRNRILIVLMIPILLVVIILASPFAILFGVSGEDYDNSGTPIIEIMSDLSAQLNNKIKIESQGEYDEINIIYMGSEGETINNSGHVLALFSVDNSMADSEEAEQVANLSEAQTEELKALFWMMNTYSTEVESIPWDDEDYPLEIPAPQEPTDENPEPEPTPTPKPYVIKHIYITCLSYEDMLDEFRFNDGQLEVLEDMMTGDFAYLFASMAGNVAELTLAEIAQIREGLPAGLSIQREQIVMTAYSLVGKVKYFWGGKSTAIGWDSRWGTATTVTGRGSSSYGTTRPFGLDCSGYVKWVFLNVGFPLDVINNSFGTGSSHQWTYSTPISGKPLPGDLAFRIVPGTGTNHVGIVVGTDASGTVMVAHCASSPNNVVVTPFSPTFRYLRRPIILD